MSNWKKIELQKTTSKQTKLVYRGGNTSHFVAVVTEKPVLKSVVNQEEVFYVPLNVQKKLGVEVGITGRGRGGRRECTKEQLDYPNKKSMLVLLH